jgi:hypothetical protein
MEEGAHTLVVSTNRGRYACDDPVYGADLTCGSPIAVLLGGQWVPGRVEHSNFPTHKYPDSNGLYSITGAGAQIGYYFISHRGETCGLCVGMKIKWLH